MKGLKTIKNFIISVFKNFFLGIYAIFYPIISFFKFLFIKKPKNKNIDNQNNLNNETKELINEVVLKDKAKQAKQQTKLEEKKEREKYKKMNGGIVGGLAKNKSNREHNKKEAMLMNFGEEDTAKSDKKQTYIYEAKSSDGKYIKGKFDAFSKVDVYSFLMNEKYEVYSIKTSPWINFLYGSSSINAPKYSKKELVFFLTQLSTYLRAGISLIDAIRIFAAQEKNPQKKKVLQAIVYELVMGESFSNALDKQGKAFPKLLVNMVKTAEMTGELPETLDDMANYYDSLEKTRKQMVSAMMYPSIVFIMSIAIVAFIMFYIVPQFVDIYEGMGAELPAITQFLINMSEFLQKYYLYIIAIITIIITILVYLYKKIKLFRTMVQYITMKIPVFGKIIIYSEVTTFTKTFGSLLNHNVFITDSMEILSKITNNEIYKMIIYDTITNLSKGDSISSSFKDHWAFPDVAYQMLQTGERTGELGKMMNKVSEFYQEQHTVIVTQLKSLIEPVMIAFLAFVVGGILLAIVIPMFSMYSQIG